MPSSTLTSKGQLTVPREIRERLGVAQGDRMMFRFDEQGRLILEPEDSSSMRRLFGILSHYKPEKPVSKAEMEESISRYLAEKHEAIRTKGEWHPYEDED